MSICYRKGGGCGPYEMLPCGECPASRPSYAEKKKQGMTVYPSRSDHKHRHDSNADRLRAKSDEELAEFFGTLPCCPPGEDLEELCFPLDSCEGTDFTVKCWLKWLRQEAKE